MSILVDNKPIEVRLRYVDRPYPGGAIGTRVFRKKEDEDEWVEKENNRRSEKAMEMKALKKEVPVKFETDARENIQELITYWKRTDWGTQSDIHTECMAINDSGEAKIDYSKFRALQMQKLMVGWNIKNQDGEPVKITPEIISKLDYAVALALIEKYEDIITVTDEEMENLD